MENRLLSRPILITGLARSGTSLVAGLISACGAWSGTTVPGNKENIKGYYEHINLRENVNKALLKKLGCDPLGVRSLPPTVLPEEEDFKKIVLEILEHDGYKSKAPWMFKDALTLALLPKAFPECHLGYPASRKRRNY